MGGTGNDTLSFGAIDTRSNGGSGIDTLRIDSRDSIDLTTISNNKFTAFEIIDITGTGNNSLAFTRLMCWTYQIQPILNKLRRWEKSQARSRKW
jgi:hypothetical protein